MELHQRLESTGNWLFRWRSYLPLFVIGIFLLVLREDEYREQIEKSDVLWEVLCFIVSFFGLAIRIFTVGHTPKRTSGRRTKGQVADTVNTTGMYSVVRHPLYLGNFLMGLGMALSTHIWLLTLIYVLFFWIYYKGIIFAEEAFLRRKFGAEYVKWAENTPAFIPRFNAYVKPILPFSLRKVLNREDNGFFAVIAVFYILEVASDWATGQTFEVYSYWTVIISVGFVIWMVVRTLRKKTTLLNIGGR